MNGRPLYVAAVWQVTAFSFCLMGCSQGAGVQSAEPARAANPSDPPPLVTGPRTTTRHTNRLADETSPYLLLHAHNPVDWYPWGPEALEKAKRENKVIFLSVGYSSCHWCHVMERESFLDEEIASFLNEHFVCIKVDREERPDVDAIYMAALHVYYRLSGAGRGGGWPMSIFLTPQAKPFLGGTYFPARDGDRGPSVGFLTIIRRVQEIWGAQPDRIRQDGESLTRLVQSELDGRLPATSEVLNDRILQTTLDALQQNYDEDHGGFGYNPANSLQPKFPESSNLTFLLHRLKSHTVDDRAKDTARRMLLGTLERMAAGGIRDHLGGGFHRYSVDRFWRIPHFEKMLYDNGQLASVYAEAFRLTGREDFKRVVDEILGFVLRELTDEQGAFYAALDAESQGEEGKYYRWEKEEIQGLLAPEEFARLAPLYGLEGPPNFEQQFYVLQLSQPMSAEADAALAPLRRKLLAARAGRNRPLTDTKILTSWNGLMIRGFADAGRALENEDYVDAARRAAGALIERLRTPEGRLLRTYGQGQAKLNAYLDDYALLVDGLIALHRASREPQWLDAAAQLMDKQIELFWDEQRGGFFFTSHDHESLIARGRNATDGAEPSGNSVSVCNLVYLAQARQRPDYLDKAERTLVSVAGLMQTAPAAAPRMAVGLAEWLDAKQR